MKITQDNEVPVAFAYYPTKREFLDDIFQNGLIPGDETERIILTKSPIYLNGANVLVEVNIMVAFRAGVPMSLTPEGYILIESFLSQEYITSIIERA